MEGICSPMTKQGRLKGQDEGGDVDVALTATTLGKLSSQAPELYFPFSHHMSFGGKKSQD